MARCGGVRFLYVHGEMNDSLPNATNATLLESTPMPTTALLPPPSPPCDNLFPDFQCLPEVISNEERLLAVLSIILVCSVCALVVMVMVMATLIHKLSTIWIKSLVRPASTTEPSDDPRKGLLQETKSSLRDPSSKAEGKKKKTSFSDDTSCAQTRDVDEEDL